MPPWIICSDSESGGGDDANARCSLLLGLFH
jgi:hypothetical protein